MQLLLLLIFLIGALWDGITTALGVATAIGANDPLGYAACFIAGILVLGFSIFSMPILTFPGLPGIILKLVWLIAIIFDFYTAFIGNAKYVVLRSLNTDIGSIFQELDIFRLLVVIGLTLIVSFSPIVISILFVQEM